MGEFIILNVEDEVRDRLRDRAERNGRSIEEEVRETLRAAVIPSGHKVPVRPLGTWCVEQFGAAGPGESVEFDERRSGPARPPAFK